MSKNKNKSRSFWCQCRIDSSWQWIPSSSEGLDALCRLGDEVKCSLRPWWKGFQRMVRGLFSVSVLGCLMSLTRGHSLHFSTTTLYLTFPRCYWAHTLLLKLPKTSRCLQWTMWRLQFLFLSFSCDISSFCCCRCYLTDYPPSPPPSPLSLSSWVSQVSIF